MWQVAKGASLGAIVAAILMVLRHVVWAGSGGPQEYIIAQGLLGSLLAVLPGFAAGWVAVTRGVLAGLIVAIVLAGLKIVASWLGTGPMSLDELVHNAALLPIENAITQCVAAVAGTAVRLRVYPPPNNSFKPTPLRGAA